jgi:uncharacterized membrane protein YjgN (DUF898 family)
MSDEQDSAFQFTGRWQEFAPIAFTNLFLTVVTLGIYRFWATTRERQYLWSRSKFIGTPLEWTGTGKELFFGFLMAVLVVGLPLFLLQFVIQALALRGNMFLVGVITLPLYFVLFYLAGVAIFRGLRYRLSRTLWRGIRGGSDLNGLAYGGKYIGKTLLGSLPMGLLIPWATTQLWNDRWNAMSYGSEPIQASATSGPLMKRFLLFYLVPLFIVILGIVVAVIAARSGSINQTAPALSILLILFFVVFYIGLPLIALSYYAAFFRNAVGGMEWAGLTFGFEARSKHWIVLFLGSLGLVVITLGVGIIFLQYRNWSFFMRHLHAYGEIDLAALGQSTTTAPTQGEGLLDAFDMGAI